MAHDTMRIAVYDEHWQTRGGGEKYAASFAARARRRVRRRPPGPRADRARRLGERLGVDLTEVGLARTAETSGRADRRQRRLRPASELLVHEQRILRSASWDLRHALPDPVRPRSVDRQARYCEPRSGPSSAMGTAVSSSVAATTCPSRHGFGRTDGRRASRPSSSGCRPDGPCRSRSFSAGARRAFAPVQLDVLVDGARTLHTVVPSGARSHRVTFQATGPSDGRAVAVELSVPNPFVPSALGLGHDDRELGVRLFSIQVGTGPVAWIGRFSPLLALPAASLTFLDSYARVVANSAFTGDWVQRLWGRDERRRLSVGLARSQAETSDR